MIKIEATRYFDSINGDFILKRSEPEVICDECGKQVVDPFDVFLVAVERSEGYRYLYGSTCSYECARKIADKFLKTFGGFREIAIRRMSYGNLCSRIRCKDDDISDYVKENVTYEDPEKTALSMIEYHSKKLREATNRYEQTVKGDEKR